MTLAFSKQQNTICATSKRIRPCSSAMRVPCVFHRPPNRKIATPVFPLSSSSFALACTSLAFQQKATNSAFTRFHLGGFFFLLFVSLSVTRVTIPRGLFFLLIFPFLARRPPATRSAYQNSLHFAHANFLVRLRNENSTPANKKPSIQLYLLEHRALT